MNRIEDIWEKESERIAQDKSLDEGIILKAISESSAGITSRLRRPLWFGVATAGLAWGMFLYNLFFYLGNPVMVLTILACLTASTYVIIYFVQQIRTLRKMDAADRSLHRVLVEKIRYLNTRFNTALHLLSLSIVLATFTINLSMEKSGGIFELRKILILSAFYLIVYLGTYSLMKLTHRIYDTQLKNALRNLEEQALRSLDEEIMKHKRLGRIIASIAVVALAAGIIAFLVLGR